MSEEGGGTPPAGQFSADSQSPSRYSYYVLGLLFVVYVVNFIDRQILAILLDPIKEDLGVSDTAMGFLTGFAFAFFYTIAGLPIARWADSGVRRNIIALGLAAWSLMTAVSGLARNFAQLAIARVGVGVGEAACTPPAHSLISDYFPPARRATALTSYATGIHVGIMIGFLAGGWLTELFDWRTAFFVAGLPGLLLAVVVRLTLREPARGQSEVGHVDTRGASVREVARFLLARRSFVFVQLAGGLHALAAYGLAVWVPAFLGRVHDMGPAEIGTGLALVAGPGGAAGVFLVGKLSDRLSPRDARWYLWLPTLTALLPLPFTLGFLLLDDRFWALACYLPHTLLGSGYVGPKYALTQSVVKVRMRAQAAAIMMLFTNLIGLGAGPQVVGILSDLFSAGSGAHSLRYALLIMVIFNVGVAVLYLVAARTVREDLASRDND
jgi:predicted MFS family arabinose efflux permease